MINPFLTNNHWAMEESKLQAIAQRASAFSTDTDDPNDPKPYDVQDGIAIIYLTGPLLKYDNYYSWLFGGSSTLTAKQNLQQAVNDPSVFATLIVVDSPGGEVPGTADLADVVAGSSKPVWAYISDTCCSGAYWIAAQADKVFCNSTARVGSIGAYCVLLDRSELYAQNGVKVTLVKAGAFKGMGVDGLPVTQAQVDDQQRGIDAIYAMFVDAVAEGRGMTNDQAMALATGQVWQGNEVLSLGLVDGIASIEEVFEQLSGVVMAGKISAFSGTRTGTVAKVAEPAPVAGAAPVVEDPKPQAAADPAVAEGAKHAEAAAPVAAAAVETPPVQPPAVQTAAVQTPTVESQIAAARAEGITAERTRLAQIAEIAPEHPGFVLEQFKAGADKATAAVAFTKVLAGELKNAKAAAAKPAPAAGGQSALAVASSEKRDGGAEKKSFIKFRN
jgi:signal peptide peptidase SppA